MMDDDSNANDGSTTRRALIEAAGAGLGVAVAGGAGLWYGTRPAVALGSGQLNAEDAVLDDNESGVENVYIQPTFGEVGNENEDGIEWSNFSQGVEQINVKVEVTVDDQSELLYDIEGAESEPSGVDSIETNDSELTDTSGSLTLELERRDIISDSGSFTKEDFPQNVPDGEVESQEVELIVMVTLEGSGNNPTISTDASFDVIVDNAEAEGSHEADANTDATGS